MDALDAHKNGNMHPRKRFLRKGPEKQKRANVPHKKARAKRLESYEYVVLSCYYKYPK